MLYRYQDMEIDLSKIKRIYPVAVVKDDGDYVHMSLEWAREKKDKINIEYYALIFDINEVKEELKFANEDELICAMQEIASYFKN